MRRTIPRPHPGLLPSLVFALAAGASLHAIAATPQLPPARLAALKSQEPANIARGKASLLQLRSQLGLATGSDFLAHDTFVNAQGRTVVHFHQLYEGHRVWAGEAIAHVEADGGIETVTSGVKSDISIKGAPKFSADEAVKAALRNLAPKGAMAAEPKVELVAFPSSFTGGIATRFDPEKKAEVVDKTMSTWAKAPSDPYVWAYEVKTLLSNKLDGHQEMSYIVDAGTGAILRKWNAIQGDTPAAGTGQSYYRGTVNLSTAQAAGGTFTLDALDRGTLPQPYVASQGMTQLGLTIYYSYMDVNTGNLGFLPYSGHATNTWGDGTVFPSPWDFSMGMPILDYSADGSKAWLQGTLTPSGETAAVDAHFGLSTTWDFYKNVFGRNGVDNLGTSTFGIVHTMVFSPFGAAPLQDNAQWSPWYFGMQFGDGTYPTLSFGMKAVTEIDITGHELSHGVTEYSAALVYAGESGALNEGNSDFFGKMVQAYADGGGAGTSVPDFPAGDLTKWEVGRNSVPSGALRYMYKPSLDGISADGWYDGMEMLDVHFSSGVLNRCMFFLSEGASSDPSSLTHSAYLPGGMTGLGNDTAARIWYKTLTEHLTPNATFDDARAGAIQSADELYGVGSAQETAVMDAWAAVNVGSAPGQPARVRVTFPVVNAAGSFLDAHAVPSGILDKVQIFPTRATVQVQCTVTNTTNTKVDWSLASSPNEGDQAGHINPDGTWTTPSWSFYGNLITITATSQADPAEFAKGRTLLMELDADTDGETDAIDLGSVAMAWGLPQGPNPAAAIAGSYSVNDWDLVFFDQAFSNANPVH
ncbi:MAG TPA: M4 family metallopeptidase [Holophagaceae bacterium]|nr:M4 family metallopeptidase [Holophagaceae bacterium]